MRFLLPLALFAAPVAAAPVVAERDLAALSVELAARSTTSEAITRAYLKRIAAMNRRGPTLRAVIAVNPDALAQARASDRRRRSANTLGELDGIPILIKDNIETADPMPTTAGSLALKDNVTRRDAPVIARLRAGGAVILGKTNLSEWANIRSSHSMSGWSAVGGLVRNPYALDRTACGSSSGTGAAVAASFAAAGLGTETNGSIVCPSSINGLVGLKPTVGLVSRTHIVPISSTQDTAGPMARSVRDAAMLFDAMVGSDPADLATANTDARRTPHYSAGLTSDGLKGRRVAVLRPEMAPDQARVFDAAVARLQAAGAVIVPVTQPKLDIGNAESTVLYTELKVMLNAYLAGAGPAVKTRTLADLIAFDRATPAEMPFFEQETFETAEATKGLNDPEYRAALNKVTRNSAAALETMLTAANADILVAPTAGAAWLSDPVHGDQSDGPSASGLPAMAGWPHLTVPMGQVDGLPVGLSLIGRRYSEATLFAAGYAFEMQGGRRKPPTYVDHAAAGPGLDGVR